MVAKIKHEKTLIWGIILLVFGWAFEGFMMRINEPSYVAFGSAIFLTGCVMLMSFIGSNMVYEDEVKKSNMRTEKEIRKQLDVMHEERKRIEKEVPAGDGHWRMVTQYIYGLEFALGVDKEE